MKKMIGFMVLACCLTFAVMAFADKDLPVFKQGETVYVCGCGAGCDCLTVARKEGKCSCGNKLVKTTVAKVEADKIVADVKGKELSFSTKAKYACACGEACNCGTISQKPGKCACGKDMKEVK
jgi:hypothetical protein